MPSAQHHPTTHVLVVVIHRVIPTHEDLVDVKISL